MPNSESESLKQWLIALAWIFFGVALVVGLTLWTIEVTSIEQIQHSSEPLAGKSLLELKNQGVKSILDALKTVATAFGGVAILFNVFYAAKRVESMDRAAIAAERNIEVGIENVGIGLKNAALTEERLITERFTKAVELLGNNEAQVRIGGIYALERISKDSPKDYWQVIEVLTAYVRERAPWPPRLSLDFQEPTADLTEIKEYKAPTDIQAILTVLGRRKHSYGDLEEPYNLDLGKTDLRGVSLTADAKFQGVNFHKANLQGAKFRGSNLQKALFMEANLQGANFFSSRLQQASFVGANLHKANLFNANLQDADFKDVNLEEARLEKANFRRASLLKANCQRALLREAEFQEASLQEANLAEADLRNTSFFWARLHGAILQQATLEGAWLEDAEGLEETIGLTEKQLKLAHIDEGFRQSEYFTQLKHQPPEDEIPF